MNKRIKDLVKKAGGDFMVTFADDTETRPSKVVSVDFDPPETLEKFVKFIVEECAKVSEDDITDGDACCTNTAYRISRQIKKHFGVEE